jgi:succinate-semialdehyde dehydrogenase/glutarate-semialdehyde dehydrogenase
MVIALADPELLREQAYVAGRWVSAPSDAARHLVADPATGETLAHVPRLTAADAVTAVDAAHAAFPIWRETPARSRALHLSRLAELMEQHEADLSLIITREQGKPLREAVAEVRYARSFVTWFAEEARRVYGVTLPLQDGEAELVVGREPVGVCVAITPWNFPCAMITRKLAAALAAGCSVVIKPAEATPLSALALALLCERAGLPAGTVNVLTGSRDDADALGQALLSHARVAKLTFTGSTAVGKALYAAAAPRLQRVTLELGGNAPFIVFEDAALERAVAGAMQSKFRNAGQTCVSANRFLVQRGSADAFTRGLMEKMQKLRLGIGTEPSVNLGPLINEAAVQKVERHVADALARGARLLCGGRRAPAGGTFYEPTLLTDVPSDALGFSEETFGPVVMLRAFDSEAEALALANATDAGLAAYVYTSDQGRAARMGRGLGAGMVGINTGLVSSEQVPFGGVKASGFGREGSFAGLDDYLQYKALVVANAEV